MDVSALRQALVTRLGLFPPRVPLDLISSISSDEGSYTRTLISYMVEPDERIPAWLLQPKGTTPPQGWPAIVAIHQHANQYDIGKSEPAGVIGDPMYHYGRELCERGYVVLCPDLLCFEERQRFPTSEEAQDHPSLLGQRGERFELTKRLLIGSCLQTKYLHDLCCSVDVLESLPDVNATHIGAIGHSLGGQEALWLAWYDRRVAAAVASCGLSLFSAIVRDGIPHNLAAYVPGMLQVGDMDMLVSAIAPCACMLIAGEQDPIFPYDGVQTIITTARDTYRQAGIPERFEAQTFPGPHSFPEAMRNKAYDFLDRWLR